MESRTCKFCGINKPSSDYYSVWSYGLYKVDWSGCKACRKVRAIESKKRRQDLHTECKKCKRPFGSELKVSAKGMCVSCYKESLSKDGYCKDCNVKFNSGSTKQTEMAAGGRCRRCYTKWRSSNLVFECSECKTPIVRGSTKGVCSNCIDQKKMQAAELYAKNSGKARTTNLNKDLTDDEFELIRRLLVKWNRQMFSMIDSFKVAQLHDKVFGHVQTLDTKPAHIQVFVMLKQLKPIFIEWNNK